MVWFRSTTCRGQRIRTVCADKQALAICTVGRDDKVRPFGFGDGKEALWHWVVVVGSTLEERDVGWRSQFLLVAKMGR